MIQNKVKIYCNSDCKYKSSQGGYGVCGNPRVDNKKEFTGIDRYYVEKCALFEARTTEKGGGEG